MLERMIARGVRGKRIGAGEARTDENHGFWPDEAPAIARATPARQAEFAAGRAAARRALRAVGLVPFPIPMGGDRAPVWPSGIVGSITHHEGHCLAVAARSDAVAGLGLDLEVMELLAADLWPEILTASEHRWLAGQPVALQGALARVIFSAKEASYKALYPLSGEVVGFDAMTIRPDLPRGTFSATLNRDFRPFPAGHTLFGQLACGQGRICTLLVLPELAECGEIMASNSKTEMQCFHA